LSSGQRRVACHSSPALCLQPPPPPNSRTCLSTRLLLVPAPQMTASLAFFQATAGCRSRTCMVSPSASSRSSSTRTREFVSTSGTLAPVHVGKTPTSSMSMNLTSVQKLPPWVRYLNQTYPAAGRTADDPRAGAGAAASAGAGLADVRVVKCVGWGRRDGWAATGLDWVSAKTRLSTTRASSQLTSSCSGL